MFPAPLVVLSAVLEYYGLLRANGGHICFRQPCLAVGSRFLMPSQRWHKGLEPVRQQMAGIWMGRIRRLEHR